MLIKKQNRKIKTRADDSINYTNKFKIINKNNLETVGKKKK